MKEANGRSFAMMLDRYLMHKNKKQVYGTQLVQYRIRDKKSENYGKMSDWGFWPIEDEKNVNSRRESIRMQPIEEYAKQVGINYKYLPENEDRKPPYRN